MHVEWAVGRVSVASLPSVPTWPGFPGTSGGSATSPDPDSHAPQNEGSKRRTRLICKELKVSVKISLGEHLLSILGSTET